MNLNQDRRSLFKLGAIGATALAMPQIMTRAAQAQAPVPETGNPGFNRFRLGGFEITTVLDGMRAGEGPHPTFGTDQTPEAMAELLATENLPSDRFVNMFTPVLVNTGTDLVLFDTGMGEGGRENGLGRTRARIEASGHRPEDVTVVVVTHMHGDHIGGLMEGDAPAYPNARYVTGQVEYDFWTAKERMTGPTEGAAKTVAAKVKPLAEKMTFLSGEQEVVSGITSMEAFGHSPGHMIFMLESDGKLLVLTADTANHYVASLRRPDWEVRFDMDKPAAAATRARVFDMVASDKLPFIGYHMPFPAVGFVEKLDVGYRWIPETYQLKL